jgi:hypothetical protein
VNPGSRAAISSDYDRCDCVSSWSFWRRHS